MVDDALLEPIKAYKILYKSAVNDEANRYFDELALKANIDIEANRATVKEINANQSKLKYSKKLKSKYHTQKGFLVFGSVFFFILAAVAIIMFFVPDYVPLYVSIPLLPISLFLAIWFIVIIKKSINPKIAEMDALIAKIQKKINELIAIANGQMAPLNSLYDWNMATTIIENVIPILDFDKYFDANKHAKLYEVYGLGELSDNDHSVIAVQSGNILGNPFIFQTQKVHGLYDKAYTGSITIYWTEYYYDSNGRRCSRRRSQVLTATTYHPAPRYSNETCLVYGNNAAPDLSFSRGPTSLANKSDKDLAKYVARHTDDLYKKAEKSLQKGAKKVFTPLANTEFEFLFDALDRDHEVQFRLLFTPLAQINMREVLRSNEGYGDDFHFFKRNRINIISSSHSQMTDLSGSPHIFLSYDYDYSKAKFVNYVNDFFKSIYFDFAPLLSIPLYQQMKSIDYIYGEDAPSNYSFYEHEVFANTFSRDVLAHPDTITDVIYKTDLIRKDGKSDKYRVRAYSYKGEERVDYVTKMGGDGNLHTIPVYWTEYIPLYHETCMELKNLKTTRNEFNNKIASGALRNFVSRLSKDGHYSFQRGLLAILSEAYNQEDDKTLDSIFSQKDE